MLAIRLQRGGRSGHAQYRVVVQDSRFSPKSGRIVAYLGNYNPHTKVTTLDKDKAASYLANGAQPSDRVAGILKSEGVKLPKWVNPRQAKKRSVKHPEKLRRNQPADTPAPEPTAASEPAPEPPAPDNMPAEEAESTEVKVEAEETPAEEPAPAEETTPEEQPAEAPAEEPPAEEPPKSEEPSA